MDGTLGQRLDALYVAVRDGAAVDRQAAFDIAMSELEYRPLHAEARELAEASTADGDETRLVSAAAAFLEACGYEPGFEQAPERFARLVLALDAVHGAGTSPEARRGTGVWWCDGGGGGFGHVAAEIGHWSDGS